MSNCEGSSGIFIMALPLLCLDDGSTGYNDHGSDQTNNPNTDHTCANQSKLTASGWGDNGKALSGALASLSRLLSWGDVPCLASDSPHL
jgi:hypothetical protein